MKKFLSKKSVMITFLVAAVAFLAFYIATLAWPVSYNMTYKDTVKRGGSEITYELKFKSNNKAHTVQSVDGTTQEQDVWIYRDGNLVFSCGDLKTTTKEQYKERVNYYKEMKKTDKEAYEARAMKVSAFKLTQDLGEVKLEAVSAGSIVLAVIGGVVELVLIAGATMSVLYRRKK